MTSSKKRGIAFSLLFLSLLQMGSICLSAILAEVAAAFPGASTVSVQFVATIPNLMMVIASPLVGLAAKRISKKLLGILACVLFLVSAVGGLLAHSTLPLLYLWSTTLGCGISMETTIANGAIADFFEGDERRRLIGLQNAAVSVGGLIQSLLCALLARNGWHVSYLTFGLALPALVLLAVCLPMKNGTQARREVSVKLRPAPLVLYSIATCVLLLCYTAIPSNLALFLAEREMGGMTASGIATAALTIGGIVAGLLYGPLARRLHGYLLPVTYLALAAGVLIVRLAPTFPVLLLGAVLAGSSLAFGMSNNMNATTDRLGVEWATLGMAVVSAVGNLGGFCAPVFTTLGKCLTGSDAVAPRLWLICAVAALAAAASAPLVRKKIL